MKSIEYPIALILGILSHVVFFNRGEHHMYVARYIQIFLASTLLAVVSLSNNGEPISKAFLHVSSITAAYLIGIYLSLTTYRVLLHPLNKFPGPLGARLSNFWFSAKLKNADAYRKLLELHQKYGDFVRIGSSDLSITHPKAVLAVYGQASKCTKASWYDITAPMVSLQSTRVKAFHDRRRRIWSPAFSDKALQGYEKRIQAYRDKLFSQIEALNGKPLNISKWFNLYSFDIMGDLAFGTSFNMLEASDEHWAIKLLNRGIDPLSWMFPTWFFRMMTAIPGLSRDWWKFIYYCADKVNERMQVGSRTMFIYLINVCLSRDRIILILCQLSWVFIKELRKAKRILKYLMEILN
jgi:tryprostatin B 6-hydroxylase